MDAYALSLVKLGCGNNLIGYYMYHGGTNPIGRDSTLQESRATGYPNDYPILNYDFATALSQYGETRPQYRWLNLLHLLAADFGRELARMEYVSSLTHPTPEDRQTLRCCLRTDGTAGFVFVNHHQRHAALCPVSDVVLDTGTVCFPPITVAGDLAFLFPFGLSLGGRTLRWATAQPICRSGDTWFFAAIPGIPARCGVQGRRHRPDAHRLLGQLAGHVGANPPPGQKEPPQHRRHGHPRQAQRRQPQRARRPHIPQPPFGRQPRKARLCRHGQHPQPGPQRQQTPQHAPGRRRVPAQLLGEQAGGRHRDARRSQRDEQPVHRQHQLVQPHTRPAQGVCQPDAQPHACQPQHHVRTGKQRRIFKVILPHPAPPPAPERAFTVQPMQRLCKT